MENDFIIEAENIKESRKSEQIRLSEEKIEELKGIIANLGNDISGLSIQKDLLIVENNNLRGLLKDCAAAIKSLCHLNEIGYLDVPVYANILKRIKKILNDESED